MANTLAPLAPTNHASDVQDFLNSMLIIRKVAGFKFRDKLIAGDTMDWPRFNEPRVQAYTASTDATIDATTAVTNTMTINQSRIATFNVDPTEIRQAEYKGFPERLARQSAFVIAQEMDQNVLQNAVDNAANTRGTAAAPTTLSTTNIFSEFAAAMADLSAANAADGPMFAVIDPHRVATLAQSEVANGFNKADVTLENGFRGGSSTGFQIYESNNLPTSVGLTVDTQPANTDTFTVHGVTWTCVTDGTAAAAGEINIGANLADFQAIFITAINGTAPPVAGDYVDVAVEDRRRYQNRQVSASAWAANVNTITAYGRQNNSETFTTATNVFGTETLNLLFGRVGAECVGMQTEPNLLVTQEPQNLSKNYLTHTLYGFQTFDRDQNRLVNMTINAA